MSSVILTRSASENHRCAPLFSQRGLLVVSAPMIERRALPLSGEEHPVHRITGSIDVLLTSSFATQLWLRLRRESVDMPNVSGYYVVGERSARMLHEAEPEIPVIVRAASAEELLREPLDRVDRLLYPCSTIRRDETVSGLSGRGIRVVELPLYQTIRPDDSHERLHHAIATAGLPAALCFFSPSAVENFFSLPADLPADGIFFAAIGSTTAEALSQRGVQDVMVPQRPDAVALAEFVAARLLSISEQ